MKNFIKICKMNEKTLKNWLEKELKKKYKNVVNGDGYLFAEGDGKSPILLTAHMDTVHKETCKYVKVTRKKGKTTLWSPQGIGGDDRCGIWMIWMIITRTKFRPTILFCEEEEIGGVGSRKFANTEHVKKVENCKYIVGLDRCNDKDAVYYDCGNLKFQRYIQETIGYTKEYGSFTDICHVSPACDRASVNLSCGYYRQHTLEEYVIFEEMFATFMAVKTLLAKAKDAETYDYKEEFAWDKYGGYYGGNSKYYSRYYDDYDYNYDYDDYIDSKVSKTESEKERYYEISYNNLEGTECLYTVLANSKYEAIGIFVSDNIHIPYENIIDMYVY